MRVLAAVVATPLRKVTGATNAGRALSEAVAQHIDLDLAIMSDHDETVQQGRLTTRYLSSTNRLGPLARFAPRSIRTPLYDSDLPALIERGQYDLVHIHNLVPAFAALRIARAADRRGVPYVISTHGFFELSRYAEISGFGPLRSLLIDLVLTRPFHRTVSGAARILALSDREQPLLDDLGVRRASIDVVTNGVDEQFFAPADVDDVAAARAELTTDDAPVLLFFGSLHGYKGVDVFLRSLRFLERPVQAIVAGGFNDPDQPRRLLEAAALPAEVSGRVRFTGRVDDRRLRAIYHLADVFVYPTEGDTLPLVVLEAMASGLPVVSTTVGGIPFEVTPECGVLVEPKDPVAVAVAVRAVLEDDQARREMGAAARRRVEQVFRWSQSAEAAVSSYERTLAGRRPTEW